MKVGFCSSPRMVRHDTGTGHPERPDRIRAIYKALYQAGYIREDAFPEFKLDIGPIDRAAEPVDEINIQPADVQWVYDYHGKSYVDRVRQICSEGGVLDAGDTVVNPGSFETALLSLGSALCAADAVMSGRVGRCFSAGRPPGHHAEPDKPMGFCLFANAAITARYLQKKYHLSKIGIVDFDVHHGNGTQAFVSDDPTIFFASIHQHPRISYPGSGFEWDIGMGKGRGYTLNIPLEAHLGDGEYLRVMDERVIPQLDEFAPEALILSAGFDAHRDDPLAGEEVSELGFELMTRSLCAVADRHCGGRVISLLEGGYDLVALGRSVVSHIRGLQG